MTNRIKGPEGNNLDASASRAVERLRRVAPNAGARAQVQPAPDQVRLTDTALQLSALQQAVVSKLPEIDSARVERVRQALAKGEYAVDAGRIADRLMALETDLAAATDPLKGRS